MANILSDVLAAATTGISSLDTQLRALASTASNSSSTDSTTFLELQNLSAEYQMAVSVTSSIMKSLSDTMQGVIQKIS